MGDDRKDLVLSKGIELEMGTEGMSAQDIMATEEQFHETMDEAREGTLTALFMVKINKMDESRTFFSGKDGEEVTTALIAFRAVYDWLLHNGLMMSSEQMLAVGEQMTRGKDGED